MKLLPFDLPAKLSFKFKLKSNPESNSQSNSSGERPLAWAQLSHQKVRLAVAMGGIAFANVLIFMQLGFLSLFSGGATTLPKSMKGDLFLLNPSAEFLGSNGFDRIRLYQAASIEGVALTTPVYMSTGTPWAYSQEHKSFEARVYAFNPAQMVFDIPELNQQQQQLTVPKSVLFDRLAKPDFGPIPQLFAEKGSVTAIVNNQRVSVIGLFSLGNSFFLGGGNLVMSEATYAELFGASRLKQVSVGVVTLEPGADPGAVKAGIEKYVPGVKAYTHEELIAKELQFQESTAVGPIFGFGTIMGLIVGVVIVYQVLYADVNDHLAEYATLKAMGYSDWSLLAVIFQEAGILAVLGFVPGLTVSLWMYGFLGGLTRLELVMSPEIALTVFLLTIVMCMMSAAIASGKLRSADPADVF
ncbi:ABC transporter permease DevC [Leptolyngbya sp. FACHB-261]|uniref:ABC transporter permease DevC n=1 Tax=Leptolyngbya sp. FACHB-261 TaxID=2692806 RepID=UPI001682ED6F|nr:ABC transporter permease DevC [Leptolyngbya sp. FACHB-261]MBD2101373.1 FtsX-like permease family protein [Leptolyngbya sp. FACHB-261]